MRARTATRFKSFFPMISYVGDQDIEGSISSPRSPGTGYFFAKIF